MKTKSIVIVIITALILASVVSNLSMINISGNLLESKKASMRIGYMPITGDYQFFIAMQKELFKNKELEIEAVKFASSNQMIEALVANKIDIIASAAAPTAYILESKSPGKIKIFAYTDDNNLPAIIVLTNSTVRDIRDLNGKKIGTFPGTTAQTALRSALENNGIDARNFELVEIAPSLQLEALVSGQVDAIYAYEPIPTIGATKGITRYLKRRPIEFIADPLFQGFAGVSAKFAANNPEQTRKVIEAFSEANRVAKENEQESRQILASWTNLPVDAASTVPLSPFILVSEMNPSDKQAAQQLADFFASKGIYSNVNVSTMWIS